MVYCTKRKLLFVHIPKTGGTSIESQMGALNKKGCGYGITKGKAMQHYTVNECREHFPITDDYWSFSIVRDPYTRFVSDYHWNKGHCKCKSVDEFLCLAERVVKGDLYSENVYYDHFMPQHKFLCDVSGNVLVDRVFRFEIFKDISSEPRLKIINTNTKRNKGSSNKIQLNEEQKSRVRQLYAKDFELFGYPS